ncbi:PAS domain-containing hybrid sensor histidine kinase/response regulator [Pseudobythopirellula maris]|nr:PAS domain S-box protein [Pseudobythopirellula maris]
MSDESRRVPDYESEVHQEIADRFGLLPNFFRLGPEAPEVAKSFWEFAKFGYLDSPLPAMFKERLFVYLSRFCDVRYCLARHFGFLVGLGRPSGDDASAPDSLDQALSLIDTPHPSGDDLAPSLEVLRARTEPFAFDSELSEEQEAAVFACAAHVFLQTDQAAESLEALRHACDGRAFQHLLVFLTFVRTAHYWTQIHPELEVEEDVTHLLDGHEALSRCVRGAQPSDAGKRASVVQRELDRLGEERERSELLRVTLASIGDAVITTDSRGRITFINSVGEKATGWSADEAVGQPIERVFAIFDEESGEEVVSPVRRALRHGATAGLKSRTRLITRDGKRLPIEDSASPIRVGGQVVGAVLIFRDVRERREQQKSLERQELQFRTLANSIAHLAWMAKPDGYVFWYNQPWYEYTGATPEEMEGWGWRSVHDPATLPTVLERWSRSLESGEEFEMVYPLRGADGVLRPFLTRVHPVLDPEGTVVQWFGTNTDISEMSRVEGELQEARSRLESILSAGEVGTWEFDVLQDVMRADRNLAAMFGVPEEQAQGAPLEIYLRAIHDDDRERVQSTIRQALDEGDTYEAEYRLRGDGSEPRWVVARGRVERDASGRAIRLPGVVVDITEQKQGEETVARLAAESERQRRLYETVLSNTEDFNYTFDLEGRFTFLNEALLDLLQKTPDEAVGKNFYGLNYPPDLAKHLQRQIKQCIEERVTIRDETTFVSHLGARQYEYIFVPVFGENGAVEAVAGSTRDITDRKRTEEALRQSDRHKDEFLATLAHELRNPLSPIASAVKLMHDSADDAAEVRQLSQIADRQLKQLVRLVDDLLDVSRISRGKVQLQRTLCGLDEIVRQAVESVSDKVRAAEHRLKVDIPAEPLYVHGDHARLTQVVTNVLNNAVKYTPDGGDISLTLTSVGDSARIEIKDSGVGIPAESLSKVFELFTQLEIERLSGGSGLGIGLALVKEFVDLHGGVIEIESAGHLQGCRVVIHLPTTAPPQADDIDDEGEPVAPSDRAAPTRPLRVLVVDDLRAIAYTLSRLMENMGHETLTADCGENALRVIGDFRPDVVVSDVSMPGMSGYELATEIRRRYSDTIGLVALTGYGMQADRDKALASGFDHHMVKPPDPDQLEAYLQTVEGRVRQDA